MAVYKALPDKFARIHPRYMTPDFGTAVMGVSALVFYPMLACSARTRSPIPSPLSASRSPSTTASRRSPASGISGAASSIRCATSSCAGCCHSSAGVAMTWAFGQSAWDMFDENYGETSIGGVGGVFILGVGMLVLGVPLMLACYAHRKEFFQGKTLTAETEVGAGRPLTAGVYWPRGQ